MFPSVFRDTSCTKQDKPGGNLLISLMDIYSVKIGSRLDSTVFHEMLSKTDTDKQNRIKRFYRWQDAHLTLFADLLVRMILIRTKDLSNKEICFSMGKFGKPVINGSVCLNFNVSHSGEWIVCVIDNRNVGIDIEQVLEIDLSIAENYFSSTEHLDIIEYPLPQVRFFEYWTLKESYVKYIGKGLSEPLDAFCIKFKNDGTVGIESRSVLTNKIYLKQYDVADGYKMAVCAEHNNFPEGPITLAMEDIITFFKNGENLLD